MGAVTSSVPSQDSNDSELSDGVYFRSSLQIDYFFQGPTLTIFEAHHINLKSGAWFVPDFHKHWGRSGWEARHFLVFWPSSTWYSAQKPPGNKAFLGPI